MTIYYRDDAGIVAEDISAHDIDAQTIDFCDGYVYFESMETSPDGYYIDKKIPVSALVRIEY